MKRIGIFFVLVFFSCLSISNAGSLECEIYKELTSHPGLKDFPVVVDEINNGYVTVGGVDSGVWVAAMPGSAELTGAFQLHREYTEKKSKAKNTILRVHGVKDVEYKIYTGLRYQYFGQFFKI